MKTLAIIAILGFVAVCSAIPSPQRARQWRDSIIQSIGHRKRQTFGCPNGEIYYEDCNTCTCIDNVRYQCTTLECHHGPRFQDTPTGPIDIVAHEAPEFVEDE
ncbi:CLUMA_CG019037, isoform A [Clunio marinus]|uniref:CLUMA_CG019037, isoform A n=1 Tax=Clunio marinus TaxID=568069 RepID=A0A1J1J1I2_9DIPT|nr:CLUMA_CG019037, isoform A [Clunio marinus]